MNTTHQIGIGLVHASPIRSKNMMQPKTDKSNHKRLATVNGFE